MMDASDAVACSELQELAELVQDKEGIPPDQQRFIFHGVRICAFPSRTLADLDIHAGDIVSLVLKLCGD
jgi:Ubiquitin family